MTLTLPGTIVDRRDDEWACYVVREIAYQGTFDDGACRSLLKSARVDSGGIYGGKTALLGTSGSIHRLTHLSGSRIIVTIRYHIGD